VKSGMKVMPGIFRAAASCFWLQVLILLQQEGLLPVVVAIKAHPREKKCDER
jgi:hypothetical protein